VNELTQEQIAEQLYIGRDAYGDIERGKTDIHLSRLAQIASFFNVDITFLFGSSPCTTNYTYSNHHTKSQYNQCHLHSAEERLQHELEKSQLTIEHLRQQLEDKQKIIDVLENNRT
jgi:transcriptional regulator with XRE-family HTH domain